MARPLGAWLGARPLVAVLGVRVQHGRGGRRAGGERRARARPCDPLPAPSRGAFCCGGNARRVAATLARSREGGREGDLRFGHRRPRLQPAPPRPRQLLQAAICRRAAARQAAGRSSEAPGAGARGGARSENERSKGARSPPQSPLSQSGNYKGGFPGPPRGDRIVTRQEMISLYREITSAVARYCGSIAASRSLPYNYVTLAKRCLR